MTWSRISIRGWEVLRLEVGALGVDILPGKGGDILAVRWIPLDLNVLWTSPWGVRPKGAPSTATDSLSNFLENYPGGWQTIFPNGGDACIDQGLELGFHGEACLVPWEWEIVGACDENVSVLLKTKLVTSPFAMTKLITLTHESVEVRETAINLSEVPRDAMWSHHPAFGAPFLSAGCRIGVDASTFVADDERDFPAGDLEPGSRSTWPKGLGRRGEVVDLERVPDEETPLDRFGYLTGFRRPNAWIENHELGLRAELDWDARVFPHAWFWLEAHATQGYPWYGNAYVLAIEPASSFPGQGLASVRRKTGNQLTFAPGEEKTATVRMKLTSKAS